MRSINYPKICGIAGIILGEILMLYTVLAPRGAEPVPLGHQIKVMLSLAPFFGAFGALVGTGVGLLLMGLLGKRTPTPPPPKQG